MTTTNSEKRDGARMFGKLLQLEVRKIFRAKSLIVLGSLAVILMVIVALLATFVKGVVKDMLGDGVENVSSEEIIESLFAPVSAANREEAEEYIKYFEDEIASIQERMKEDGSFRYTYLSQASALLGGTASTTYYYKSQIALYKDIIKNGRYGEEIPVFSDATVLIIAGIGGLSAEGFIMIAASIFMFFIGIYTIIIASGAYADEFTQGTIKIMLMRPVTRNKLTSAKLISVIALPAAIYFAMVLVATIFGYIAYDGAPGFAVTTVFNASVVGKTTMSGLTAASVFENFFVIAAYGILAFAVGTLTKKRFLGVLVPIVVYALGSVLNYALIGSVTFNNVAAFITPYMTTVGTGMPGQSFTLSFIMYLVYTGLLVFFTYFAINKRDVA
ncbi:MAG: ABC transporter permease [Christensenellaceae bacterium]|jgi:ABC-type transport system involved in multi-copper enzyme maturation permease subunit|nr:ABC transporter permease [Christensenellaceae bacterium]